MRLPRSALGAVASIGIVTALTLGLLTLAPETPAGAGPERPATPAPSPPPIDPEELRRQLDRPEPQFDLSPGPVTGPELGLTPAPGGRQAPPQVPIEPIAPSEALAVFTSDEYPITFEYPENWVLQRRAEGIELTNYDPTVPGGTSGGLTAELIKIYLFSLPGEAADGRDARAFLNDPQRAVAPPVELVSDETLLVGGQPAIRRIITTPAVPEGAVPEGLLVVAFPVGNDMLAFEVYTAGSELLPEFDKVLSSVRVKPEVPR